jgi:hypothetical protein
MAPGFPGSEHTMLTNIALWIILAALIVIIPCGCLMTRPRTKTGFRRSEARLWEVSKFV